MHLFTRLISLLVPVVLLLMLCGCPPPSSGDGNNTGGNGTAAPATGGGDPARDLTGGGSSPEGGATDMSAYYDGDNINYKRVNIGLNGKALDYIAGDAPLCGAKQASMFFFGDDGREETGLYLRDLESGARTQLTSVKQIVPSSLNCSNQGSFLCYARRRPIGSVIDSPDFEYPQFVAELYRLDTASGEETKLFNFGSEFSMYRNDSLYPFVSEDGERIVCLSYDINRLLLQTQCIEWLKLYTQLYEEAGDVSPEQRASDDENMRIFLRKDHVAPKLREQGYEVSAETPIDNAARDAVQALFDRHRDPVMSLLIWEDGEARAQVLTPYPGQERSLHFIIDVSEDMILMGANDPSADPTGIQEIYSVDMATGELSQFGSYQGAPSMIEFDAAGENLVVVYNPFDRQNKEIDTVTHVLRIPADGSDPVDISLGADYFGFLDINADASILVGQNRDDLWLYRVDVATGNSSRLSQHFVDLDGLYLDGPGSRVVYLENMISFVMDVPADPQSSPDWISDSYFSEYRDKVSSFLDSAGFEIRDDQLMRFEERTGMGVSQTSIELSFERNPEQTVLFRYDNNKGTFSSMWSPVPGTIKLKPEFRRSEMDYFECLEVVEGIMDRLGWENPNTREPWYPGASPLYDGKSDSYVITVRDGYWYDPAVQEHWVYNAECTMRIVAGTGDIAEINFVRYEQINDQDIRTDLEMADHQIRNYGNDPIPEGALDFDYEGARLLIAEKKPDVVTPGDYLSQVEERIVYEVNGYLEGELVLGSLVDAEDFSVLGRINYMPLGMRNPNAPLSGGEGAAPAPAEGAPVGP